jgi:peroxiredoxin-like protein
MAEFPHHYTVTAELGSEGPGTTTSAGLPTLAMAAPAEFGGPGDHWSPETLLMAAVADCFVLSFRAIAQASRYPYKAVRCEAVGELDRVDRQMRFTKIELRARLEVDAEADEAKGLKLLEKAEASCLITNSMTSELHLETEIVRG